MTRFKNLLATLIVAMLGGFISIYIYRNYFQEPQIVEIQQKEPVKYTAFNNPAQNNLPDLTLAAERSVHCVVHIQSRIEQEQYYFNPFDFFFGDRNVRPSEPQYSTASGSGVILSTDGYIVTNNHVVEQAKFVDVILNDNRKFEAKIIGKDPNTDLALLQIDADNLKYLSFGDSETLRLGEWVLAVGNPFSLNSTVTAGIVSAKSRSIGIMSGQMPIESFIQTDAAVNPGNSGGALVNAKGELVGINTAIYSRTGSYTGYSFAIPSSLVQKVVADLKEYGEVQRALLGVSIRTVDQELKEEKDLDKIEGVYIANVSEEGAAMEAGLKEGDIILSIGGTVVNSTSELQEQVGKYRPGDKTTVLIKRSGKNKLYTVTLKNSRGDTGIVKATLGTLGAKFAPVSNELKYKLRIRNGLQIIDLEDGKLKEAGVKEKFIITHINKRPVTSEMDIKSAAEGTSGGILIEGLYPNGERAYFVFSMN